MTETLERLRLLTDRIEIEALSTQFSRALDGGTPEMFVSVFTPDVVYNSGGRRLSGHTELRDFFEARAAGGRLSRHLMTGLAVTFDGPDRAQGVSCWLVFAGEMPPPAVGAVPYLVADVSDSYVRTPDGWRIAQRTIAPIFRNADVAGPRTSAIPAG